MSTTVKTGRAWVPATVTTLLAVLLLAGCGLLLEWLEDRGTSALADPESLLGAYLLRPMAPVGGPGLIGEGRDFSDSIAQLGGGLVPVVVLVFLFTWLAARAARNGPAFTVFLGAWLGTVLGVGLGALATLQVFLWQTDIPDYPLLEQERVATIGRGLYWGAGVGLALGLLAALAWLVSRKTTTDPDVEAAVAPDHAPDHETDPADTASFPPPDEHAVPVAAPGPAPTSPTAPASPAAPAAPAPAPPPPPLGETAKAPESRYEP